MEVARERSEDEGVLAASSGFEAAAPSSGGVEVEADAMPEDEEPDAADADDDDELMPNVSAQLFSAFFCSSLALDEPMNGIHALQPSPHSLRSRSCSRSSSALHALHWSSSSLA